MSITNTNALMYAVINIIPFAYRYKKCSSRVYNKSKLVCIILHMTLNYSERVSPHSTKKVKLCKPPLCSKYCSTHACANSLVCLFRTHTKHTSKTRRTSTEVHYLYVSLLRVQCLVWKRFSRCFLLSCYTCFVRISLNEEHHSYSANNTFYESTYK